MIPTECLLRTERARRGMSLALERGEQITDYVDQIFEGSDTVITVAELARILNVSAKTVYEYLQNGDIPAYRVASKWIIIRDEVKAHISASANGKR